MSISGGMNSRHFFWSLVCESERSEEEFTSGSIRPKFRLASILVVHGANKNEGDMQ